MEFGRVSRDSTYEKRGTPYLVAYCPCPIVIQLIQIDDCRRLFARSVRWRIIRAEKRGSPSVGLIFNRHYVENAGQAGRCQPNHRCADNNHRVTPILSPWLAQY